MKCLNKKNTIEEFNDILKEGLEFGFILTDSEDIGLITELYNNLTNYFLFFKSWQKVKGHPQIREYLTEQ